MTILRSLLAILSLLLAGAHLLRWGGPALAVVPLLALPLVFLQRRWAREALRALLALAVLEWLRAAWVLAAERQQAGQPYLRMLAILGAVAAVTSVAAWLAGWEPRRRA